jgi:serine/threonine-protein kinase ULK/ATG1
MIVDNLTLEKCLGKGAFGEVYLTTKKGVENKKFATKKFEREEIEQGEAMKYLKNEIIILQYLNHPNIVKFEEVKKTKKHFYIVMEFCNGGELSKALEKYQEKYGKPFPEEIVQHFMRQIVDAFKYMHERKIIHRDVKLDNILLNYDNEEDKKNMNLMKAQVKIIDFGFACKISKAGLQYTALGSPINMDPLILKKINSSSKKARQLGYNQKADIWSIGTICYEMLIGKSAFDAEDMDELVSKIEDGSYTIPTNLSSEVISFLNGMLQYDSSRRLSADQLSRHAFLTKNVQDFKPIDLKKVEKKVDSKGLKINVKKNSSIWSIFNAEDEDKLANIQGNDFVKPIDEREELEFEKQKKAKEQNCPFVQLPSKGIPDNPTNMNVGYMTQEEQANFGKELSSTNSSNLKESDYVFSGGIFDK